MTIRDLIAFQKHFSIKILFSTVYHGKTFKFPCRTPREDLEQIGEMFAILKGSGASVQIDLWPETIDISRLFQPSYNQ